jgi:hypothetical protein
MHEKNEFAELKIWVKNMIRRTFIYLYLVALGAGMFSVIFGQVPEVTITAEDSTDKNDEANADKEKKKKTKGKTFDETIEDCEVIGGLFTLYHHVKEGKVYLEIKPEQFNKVYLCNITRTSGDGSLFDSGAMLGEFAFFFKRVGKKVQFVEKNVKFRAKGEAAIAKAVERDIPNSIRGNAKTLSDPHPERGSVLVEAAEFFLQDIAMVGYLTGQAKTAYSLDKGNSYFSQLKSFPLNTDIEVTLHFKSSSPQPFFTLADSRSILHRYYYSISEIPGSNYQPRAADDRVGHFYNLHQDYTSVLKDDPYERYIHRWHLEKSEPKFKLSKPKKAIVFWLENTIPVEYRDAVREGALLWNAAFEKIGFKDAIEVKQMPDDADWDPADVRYNTIRWIVQPGGAYAVGPSRANPFTGEIYDADIRISADILRFFYQEFDEFVSPSAWTGANINSFFPGMEPEESITPETLPHLCGYAEGFQHQMAFGWGLLQSQGRVTEGDLQQYIHDALLSIVAHEVGHTLGLRHNFKASAIHSLEKIQNKNYTLQNGLTGSLMDYTPVNIAERGQSQGYYFQTTPGPYDYWAIEYAYTSYDPDSKISEKEMLEKIARRAVEPQFSYGTDEDAFGLSTRSLDPTCNLWDIGNDPLQFYQVRLNLAQGLWRDLLKDFERDGELYNKLRLVFNQGIKEYALAGQTAGKYIGGIYTYRDHIGDPNGRPPFVIVPAAKQREALQFLVDKFFSPNSFEFSPDLLNKLAPPRYWDFEGTVFRISRLDYPIHGIVQLLQAMTLFRLYDPLVLGRIQDNEIRFPKGDTPFTMAELFSDLRYAIWQEVAGGKNVSSFRRELQRMHLYVLDGILKFPPGFPHDAVTLAREDLVKIKSEIDRSLSNSVLDAYTEAHLQESAAKINAILSAQMERRF